MKMSVGWKKVFCVCVVLLVAGWGFWLGQFRNRQEWRPGFPLDKTKVRVGVIHISNMTDAGKGYAWAHDYGIQEMQAAVGLEDSQILRRVNVSDTNLPATEYAIRECIAEGANIIIATSWNHMDVCEKLAEEFPGVVFANATGFKSNATNLTNYFGKVHQPRYLSGIVAGLRTRSNKIGYVAAHGRENSEVTGGIDAFALGVASVNSEAVIHVQVTKRWFDPDGEYQAARTLIEKGCDVIAQHCNTSSAQKAAQDAGVWGIGYNVDMKSDAPEAVITSVVWNWGIYYTELIRSVIDGTFVTTPWYGDMKSGIVTLTPLSEKLAPEGAEKAVEAAKAAIERGDFNVFDGEILTNAGQVVGVKGGTLPDEEIIRGIHWYCHNVVSPQE
ncbi:MAG: BMP family ABC transporter substrate-binding protein [Synergistaceae bacterium]|jgi:basic membrane protein A|nr:BMP family ABC transporter substrate-binding protein [Synergistaceae bacterium]